jgi:hypothetical protein
MKRALWLLLALAACVKPLSEKDLPCPCGRDYVCCIDVCLPPDEVCTSPCGDGVITHDETCDPLAADDGRLLHASCEACVLTCDAAHLDCENGATDGCETDPASSPLHCGACNHACVGDEICRDGVCAAVVAEESTGISGVWVDDAAIYWTDPGAALGADLRAWREAEGVITLAAGLPPVVAGPVVVDDHVVWASINAARTISRLGRIAKDGSGDPEIWFDDLKPIAALSAGGAEVVYLESGGGGASNLWSASVPPNPTFEVAGVGQAADPHLDLASVYWRTPTAVMRAARGSNSPATFVDAAVTDYALAEDGVYVVDGATLTVHAVTDGATGRSVPTSMRRLAVTSRGVVGLDDSTLLFLGPTDDAGRAVLQMLDTPRLLAASDTYVVWVEGDPAVLWRLRLDAVP